MRRYLLLAICLAFPALGQPVIRNVTNAASNTDTLLPNSSIAQGSMFVIKGDNLGPPAFDVASTFPLTTSRSGTSVQITSNVNNQQYPAIIYYSGASQVAAIVPSAVPVGGASIRLTYTGVSQSFNVTIVKSQLGVFTINTSGAGEAVATRSDNYSRLSPINPAHPGDVIILWATGLGPTTGDETQAAQQFDMTTIPVQAWIGGKTADIVFRGRNACCTSVDTIYVRVPSGIAGCATPVTFKVGDTYSNTTLIPTALSGNLCTPNNPSVTSSDLSQLVNKTTIWVGNLTLQRAAAFPNTSLQPVTLLSSADQGFATFVRAEVFPGWLGYTGWDLITPRSCIVTTTGGFVSSATVTPLITNDSINIVGPGGAFGQLKQDSITRIYYGLLGGSGQYVVPGNFNITTGFINNTNASVTLNYTSPVTWTNFSQISTVDRTAGVTVNWSGGDGNGFVQITAVGTALDRAGSGQVQATAACIAPAGDHTFTIPGYILSALPATQTGNPAVLVVSGIHSTKKIDGGGLDVSSAFIYDHGGINVSYR